MSIKKQIYIIISVFFLLDLALVVFLILPIFSDISKSSRELSLKKNNIIILKNQFTEADKFKQKYEDYKSNLEKIDSLFVDSQNPVAFIEFLEKSASDFGLNMQISTPLFSKKGSSQLVSFQLLCSGSFSGTLKFAKTLEAGNYLIKIQKMDIKASEKKKDALVGAEILIKALAR